MKRPEISVVLPVYNGEKYLQESLESVLGQTFEGFELIIWNDGSTDSSQKMIDSIRDSRLKKFRSISNQGIFKTLNLAIKKSNCNLIKLWTQDDIMKPECLEKELEFHKNHSEIGMSYTSTDFIDENGDVLIPAKQDETPEVISKELAAQLMFYYGTLTNNISTVMLKREVIDNIGLFNENLKVSGDYEMWTRISGKYTLGFIKEPLVFVRMRNEQYGRHSGSGFLVLKETKAVVEALKNRLPKQIREYSDVYHRWGNKRLYFHYMLCQFLSCNFNLGIKTFKELRSQDNLLILFGIWLISLNGRLFKKVPIIVENS